MVSSGDALTNYRRSRKHRDLTLLLNVLLVSGAKPCGEDKANMLNFRPWMKGAKRVLLIAASILAARKLAHYGSEAQVPATICAISDAIRWAERIMQEIDRHWPNEVGG